MDNKNNTGKDNSGYRNSGHWNSGHRNSGDWNSGYRNSGYRNSGHRNSGHRNSGDWNSGDWNSGYFNTNTPKIRIFNKETEVKREDINFPDYFYFDLIEWIEDKSKTEEGYLKVYDYKEAWKNSFEKADIEDVKKTLELPNFDYEIFEEITGISKRDFDKRLRRCEHEGVKYCKYCGALL